MTNEQRLVNIIEVHLPGLLNGRETVESIVKLYPKQAAALRPRLEAALWLNNASRCLQPRPGYIAASRKYMEQSIACLPHQSAWNRLVHRYSIRRWIFNIAAPVILVLLLALEINSVVLSAKLAIPGDLFYPAKQVVEGIQLAFTFDTENRTDLYVKFSRERTTEFVELVLEGEYGQLPAAADRMETDLIAALHALDEVSLHDPAGEITKMASLRDTLSNEIIMLQLLKETSPDSAHAGIDLAIQIAESGIMALR